MSRKETGLAGGSLQARSDDQLSGSISSKDTAPAAAVKFHPLADIFPLMEGEEFDALVADIKANGLNENIVLYEGKVLDGRNRYRACMKAGIEPHFCRLLKSDDPAAYVISANIHRRHLTAEQKRELIAKLIKAQPEKSDRQIGKMAKAHKNTARDVRSKLEARGQVAHVETRTDTKGRKQPAKKRKPGGTQLAQDRKECVALYQKVVAAEREAELGHECVTATSDGSHWVCDGCGKRVAKSCGCPAGATAHAEAVLVENAPPPDVNADNMKAQFAAIDDGSDPGPIPDCLRRVPKAVTS